jgi:hypothetical protein
MVRHFRWHFYLVVALCCFLSLSAYGADSNTPATAGEEAHVTVFNRQVATFRSAMFGVSAQERARRTRRNIIELLERDGPGVVTIRTEGELSLVMLDDIAAVSFGPGDIDNISGETREKLLAKSVNTMRTIVREKQESRNSSALLWATSYALMATALSGVPPWRECWL